MAINDALEALAPVSPDDVAGTTRLYGSLVMKIHEARMIADQARRLTSTATTRKAAACWTERANALVEAALGLKDTVGIDLPDPDDIPPQRAGESLCDYEVRIGFRAPASAPVAPASVQASPSGCSAT